jgi:omega-amidase
METPKPLRTCVVQLDLAWESPEENYNKVLSMLHGQEGQYDLIVLPEMFTTGFTMKPNGLAEPTDGETLHWMKFLAAKHGAVVMGSIIIEEEGKFYNRLLVVEHGGLALKYDKRHLFRMAGEHDVYTAGQELQVFELKGWRICPIVCYDLRFPVWSRNGAREDGRLWYDLLVYVANWPERRVAHWKALLQARAIENQAYVIGANRVGKDGNEIVYSGDSQVIDPFGAILRQDTGNECILSSELDWEVLADYREKFPAWRDADQFGLYV